MAQALRNSSEASVEPRFLSVTQLNTMLNASLEEQFPGLLFQGEISTVSRPASGHLYITLKDDQSQLAAVIWRSTAQRIDFPLEVGVLVQCRGRPNVYHATGKLQIIVDRISPAGEGLLQKKFLELKAKLEKEGLFAEERKRKIPFLPKAVGVVTSDSGAVIKDIMVKIRERMPQMQVFIAPCRVQGDGAASEIAASIRLLNRSKLVDVIIVARGGGSLQDLWAFNEEETVRAIFGSALPIVSGVGHEVDITLSDLVADARAPTPTAAAEMVVPKCSDLIVRLDEFLARITDYDRWLQPLTQRVDDLTLRLDRRIETVFESAHLRIETLGARLSAIEPRKLVNLFKEKLSRLQDRLLALCGARISNGKENLGRLESRLNRLSPVKQVSMLDGRVSTLEQRFKGCFDQYLFTRGKALGILESKLDAINPKRVLERGFAFVERDGEIIRDAEKLKSGEVLAVTFHKGKVESEVRKIFK